MISLSTPGLLSRYFQRLGPAELALLSANWVVNERTGLGAIFVPICVHMNNHTDANVAGWQFTCNGNFISDRFDVFNDAQFTVYTFNPGASPVVPAQAWPQVFSINWGSWAGTTGYVNMMFYGSWISPVTFGYL